MSTAGKVPARRYRQGGRWGVTVVQYWPAEIPDEDGHRPGDRLICMALTPEDARMIVAGLNHAAGGE